MTLNMHQRSGAPVRRIAIGRSHGNTQNGHGAIAMPSDLRHQLDARSASTRLAMTKARPESDNPANIAAVAELLARVEELLRPSNETRETVLRVGPLQLDLLTRRVKRDERTIDLRPREFCLLEYMMRRRGQVLTRSALFLEVWNYKFTPQSNLVDVHMGRLRHKIDATHEPPMIFNVRGQGFVLRAPG
jgi:DNA-binding winged helix-turn-helix (wHTH) protein